MLFVTTNAGSGQARLYQLELYEGLDISTLF